MGRERGRGLRLLAARLPVSRLQHGLTITAAGTLLLSSEEDGPTTVAREYQVRHGARELDEVFTFDAEVHAVTNGDAVRTPNGNTLHVVGSAGVIKEAAPNGDVWCWTRHVGQRAAAGPGRAAVGPVRARGPVRAGALR